MLVDMLVRQRALFELLRTQNRTGFTLVARAVVRSAPCNDPWAANPARQPHLRQDNRRDLRARGTAAYRARLDDGWEHACTYAASHNEGELDFRAADFVQSCYDARDPRGLATYGLLAIQKRCRAKGCPEETWSPPRLPIPE